jgi:hypothetical protein
MSFKILEKWWNNSTKTFTVIWYPQHFFRCFFKWHNNGARKGIDRCYDGSLWLFGICFNYVNWRYDA